MPPQVRTYRPRDVSAWPQSLKMAFTPGFAPTLDKLARGAALAFFEELDATEHPHETFTLRAAVDEFLCTANTSDMLLAIVELARLNEYALPSGFNSAGKLDNAITPLEYLTDLLAAALWMRACLDPEVEYESRALVYRQRENEAHTPHYAWESYSFDEAAAMLHEANAMHNAA